MMKKSFAVLAFLLYASFALFAHSDEIELNREEKAELAKLHDEFLEKNKLDLKCLFALTAEVGCPLSDLLAGLGDPDSQEIDQHQSGTMIRCRWNLGKGKTLYVNTRNGRIEHVSPDGFSVTEFAKYKKAVAEFMSIDKEYRDIVAQKRKLVDKEKSDKERLEQLEKRREDARTQMAKNRPWRYSNGRTINGVLDGIDKDFVLIRNPDAPADRKPIKVEAVFLCWQDRDIVTVYCEENKLTPPELDPTTKIKKGMPLKVVENILGKPDGLKVEKTYKPGPSGIGYYDDKWLVWHYDPHLPEIYLHFLGKQQELLYRRTSEDF